MKHLRRDYDRIQDPLGKIGADEPVFLLRAKDRTAPWVVRHWADNQSDPTYIHAAYAWAAEMERWQVEHADIVKMADAPEGALRYDRAADRVIE